MYHKQFSLIIFDDGKASSFIKQHPDREELYMSIENVC